MNNKYASIIEKLQGRYSDDLLVGPMLDEAHLKAIEAQLGYSLPKDYREFLRDYAKIRFPSAEFTMVENGQPAEFSIFMFYGSTEESTLADVYYEVQANLEFDENSEDYPGIYLVRDITVPLTELGWPKELLPIGSDQGGNQICLALFGLHPGAIFFWRSNPLLDQQNLYLIASSFDEFMHMLYNPNVD